MAKREAKQIKKKTKLGIWVRKEENSREIEKICLFGEGINDFGMCQIDRVMVVVSICQRKVNDYIETVFPNIKTPKSPHIHRRCGSCGVHSIPGGGQAPFGFFRSCPLDSKIDFWELMVPSDFGSLYFSGRAIECHPSKSMPLNLPLVQSSGFRDAHSVLVLLWLLGKSAWWRVFPCLGGL